MTGAKKAAAFCAVVVIVAISVGRASTQLWQRGRAKTTMERIRTLSTILLAERPRAVNSQVLARLTAKYNRQDVLKDAWGRPLTVTMEGERYVVRSSGRDGTESGCCVAADDATPDTDLIAVDGEWRQVWN